MSEEEICNHLERTKSLVISKSSVHKIISSLNEEINQLSLDYEIDSEKFYGYDEQYVKINGRRAYRIVFLDIKDNEIIFERTIFDFNKSKLIDILKEVFKDKKPKGFVTDMRLWYPNAFEKVFGKEIKMQFCIFHLNKALLKAYKDSIRIGRCVKWTLNDQKMLYLLFDIFYDRSEELFMIDKLINEKSKIIENLTDEKILELSTKYRVVARKETVLLALERHYVNKFRKFCKSKRLARKRNNLTLKVRNIEESVKKLDENLARLSSFPKELWKSIKQIQKNFEFLTASGGEVTTNNKLEGFFGATLKKFRKKQKRSMQSFSAFLKYKQLIKRGISLFKQFDYRGITKIFALVCLVT